MNDGRTGGERSDAARRVVNVAVPSPHDGVGSALRRSFGAVRPDVPCDMVDLLRRLDRI
ncbi:hypothetical protein WG908_09315 [Sphingobium sp. AN641]|uniref:hypothetical protein n=1 Tax=Sphingobium sp. AN641 TaxID=3133443 RepID=UPI0030BBC4EF